MSDQLEDLKRQRALVADHLAWLDRLITDQAQKIQAEKVDGGRGPGPGDDRGGPEPSLAQAEEKALSTGTVPKAEPSPHRSESDALFERFAAEERPALNPPSKFGCWLGFSLLLLTGVGAVVAIIYGTYR